MKGWQARVPNGATVRITRTEGSVVIRVGEARSEALMVLSPDEANVIAEGLAAIMRHSNLPELKREGGGP